MQSKKDNNIFEKLVKRNYKNELEEVLEDKFFGETAKSLLLEILYKVEAAYRDYEIAKKDTQTKEEYIENFIRIIKQKCKSIKVVGPNSEQRKLLGNRTFIVNKKKGEITCLPIGRKLLYSISKIDKKDKIVNTKYYLLSTTLSNLINVGDNINTVEPLRDFNGWSWTTVAREYESIEYNLIYQVMLILLGKEFLSNWVHNGETIIDYVEEMENKLENEYGKELSEKIVEVLSKLSILMELKVNKDIREEIVDSTLRVEEDLEKFHNKTQYIKELTIQKNELKNKIKQIDTTINDKDLLQKEYTKRNENLALQEKIFSMRILAQMMAEERKSLFEKLEECNSLLKPQNFLRRQEELEQELDILKLADVEDEEIALKQNMKLLQELFLECFKLKIKNASLKQDIVELIYRFRYYCLLPYNENENIYMNKDIQGNLNEVGKLLIRKAIENKVIIAFSQYENLNYEIVKKIFNIRIIELEELSIKITKEKEEYFVQFFDQKAFDQKVKLDVQNINKKQLEVKLNKKIKLFE